MPGNGRCSPDDARAIPTFTDPVELLRRRARSFVWFRLNWKRSRVAASITSEQHGGSYGAWSRLRRQRQVPETRAWFFTPTVASVGDFGPPVGAGLARLEQACCRH